jgi:hypothetical protein
MPTDFGATLRDVIVLAYMIFLRVAVPLLITLFIGKWIQRKMAEQELREQRARMGEPYCWDNRNTAQTQRAKLAAAAHPELPCWLAVQSAGGGVIETCYSCPRYTVQAEHTNGNPVEVG